MALSEKQKLFAQEYVKDTNATQAAINAGYSERAARSIASRLLKNEEVKSYITELMAEIKSKKIADATEVLEFLTSIMRGEEQEYSNISVTVEDGVEMETSKKGRFTPKIEDRLNAAYELLKRYPLMLEDELQKARLKKAIADAKISEAKVRILTEGGDKVADRIDEFMDKLVEEVKEDEST